MRFLRHLTAVVLAVAVIIGLGLLWAHTSGGGTGETLGPAPSREAFLRLQQFKGGPIRTSSDDGFHLADTGNLIRTCVIEALLATVVISVSAARWRRRRMRRMTAARTQAAKA